jgi:hypothetical protein
VAEKAKSYSKDKIIGAGKSAATMIVLFAIVFIPAFLGGVVKPLTAGSAAVNNAYVEKLNEFWKDPEVAKSKDWVNGFTSAGNALYAVNERCFYIDPGALSHNDLLFYALYAEASYDQMVVLEDIAAAVQAADQSNIEALMQRFNATIDKQAQAVNRSRSWLQGDESVFVQLPALLVDGVRFYVSQFNINMLTVAIMILALGALAFLLALEAISSVGISKVELLIERFNRNTHRMISSKPVRYHPETGEQRIFRRFKAVALGGMGFYLVCIVRGLLSFLFLLLGAVFLLVSIIRPRNFLSLGKWIKSALFHRAPRPEKTDTVRYAAYRKEKRKTNMIVGIVVVSLFSVIFAATNIFSPAKPDQLEYLDVADSVLIGYSMDISAWLAELKSDPGAALSDEKKQVVLGWIENQVQAIASVRQYADVPDEYKAFHAGLDKLCLDEDVYLTAFRECVDEGEVPTQAMMSNYVSLRAKNYSWLLSEYAGYRRQQAFDSVNDIFD